MTSSNSNHLPKAPSPNTTTLGLRLQCEFWAGHKFSSITPSLGSHFHTNQIEVPTQDITRGSKKDQLCGRCKGFFRLQAHTCAKYDFYCLFLFCCQPSRKKSSIPRQKPPWNWGHAGPPFLHPADIIEHLLCVGTGDHGMNEMRPVAPRTNTFIIIPYSGDGKQR